MTSFIGDIAGQAAQMKGQLRANELKQSRGDKQSAQDNQQLTEFALGFQNNRSRVRFYLKRKGAHSRPMTGGGSAGQRPAPARTPRQEITVDTYIKTYIVNA